MFSKIFGNTKDNSHMDNNKQKEFISKMTLTDMKSYINDRIEDYPVEEDGLTEILNKLLKVDEKTSKRYINIDDMDSKIKKGFDLVLNILSNKKITVDSIELASQFAELSKPIIDKYDKDHKEIYSTRFTDSITLAIQKMNLRSELEKKMNFIEDNS